jgi:hypothetical protein
MGRTTIDELLADARHDLTRLDPTATRDAMRRGAALIDIRVTRSSPKTEPSPGRS